jgi:hypothetical protein
MGARLLFVIVIGVVGAVLICLFPPGHGDSTSFFASIVIWVALLYLAIVLRNRAARRPRLTVPAAVRLLAMLIAGYAVASAELSLALDAQEDKQVARRLQSWDSHLFLEYAWRHSSLFVYAAGLWALTYAVGLVLLLIRRPKAATPIWDPQPGRDLNWVRTVPPWPREYWLGGPVRG